MSFVEQARERLEEVRTKGVRATLEEKFPRIGEMRGGGGSSSGGNPGPLNIREKGILGVLAERFPKIKEIREKGLLTRFREKSTDEYQLRDETTNTEKKGTPALSTKGYQLRR
ncbi:hypothetical protein ES703_57850 [subsurface metagenome]